MISKTIRIVAAHSWLSNCRNRHWRMRCVTLHTLLLQNSGSCIHGMPVDLLQSCTLLLTGFHNGICQVLVSVEPQRCYSPSQIAQYKQLMRKSSATVVSYCNATVTFGLVVALTGS